MVDTSSLEGIAAASKTGSSFTPNMFQGKYGVFEVLIDDPIYGDELKAIKNALEAKNETLANDLWNRSKWGRLDSDAQLNYLTKFQNDKLYKERLNSWLIGIKKQIAEKGLTADDKTLEQYFLDGIDNETILNTLAEKVSTVDTKGVVATSLQSLRNTAFANGLSIEKDFGKDIDTWLVDISKGTPLSNFIDKIRAKAAENKPKYIQEQLKLGNDLRTIYGTYIGAMAQAFNIDPQTIDINDELLKKAFTDEGPIKINDFRNLLKSDERFKQTPSAASESEFRKQVVDRALLIGATVTDSDIDVIVKKLLSTGVAPSLTSLDAELRPFIKIAPTSVNAATTAKLAGQAGNNLQTLKDTASRNGLDLEKAFGGEIENWLQKINQGESIETYKRIIRDAAKMGLPDNVKKMLDQGVDLTTIFNPYRSYMAKVLEINPESIDINDPVLRSAIGPEKEMTIYDFQRSLRKDPRWQYTDNARQEVSNAALQVLRDFGFQG